MISAVMNSEEAAIFVYGKSLSRIGATSLAIKQSSAEKEVLKSRESELGVLHLLSASE